MRIAPYIMFALLPLAAQAQQVAWGNEAGCNRVAGIADTSDDVFIFWPDRIERWESTCQIKDISGNDLRRMTVVETECSGEGEIWVEHYNIMLDGETTLLVLPFNSAGASIELRPCG